VVIAIAILLLAIAVPAFSSVLYSSRRSGAAGAVQTALAAARDVALESGPGRDAAAVFFADPGGRMRIMVAVQGGEIADATSVGGARSVRREVFVRSERVEPITLPAGWAVSGRARANMIDNDWYDSTDTYPSTTRTQDNWVYPETSFFDRERGDDGRNRQTFMVRFAGGSGGLTYGDDRPALVVDPAPTRTFRDSTPWRDHDLMGPEGSDQRRFVQRVMLTQGGGPKAAADRRRLLGDESSDTALARPVGQVAVYSMRQLARGVGARRLNPVTGSLYADPAGKGEPEYDTSLFDGKAAMAIAEDVSKWISGQPVDGVTDSDAQIFTVQRYLGRPLEAVAIGGAP
jgi:type II secretory pathway pseudopilin PulG